MQALDLSQYTCIPHVAVLDAFSDPDLQLEQADLERIAANNNTRIADTGDLCPLIIGHTEEGAPETAQPPIVGYATNFSVAAFGNVNPRPCLFADFLVPPDKVDLVRRFPRRSVELYENEGLIDPIALLGATTPRRSLGLLLSKSKGNNKRRFEFDSEKVDMDPQEMMQLFMGAFDASPAGRFLQKLMDEQGAVAGDEEKDQASTDTPAAPAKNQATHVPTLDCPEKHAMSKTDDKVRLERDEYAIKLAKVEQKLAETTKVAEEAAQKLRRQSREGDLKQLLFEGYQFDLAEEISYVDALADDQYGAYVAKIKQRFQRTPVGKSPLDLRALTIPTSQPSEQSRKELALKARKYAEKHKCDYKTAFAKVQAGEQV